MVPQPIFVSERGPHHPLITPEDGDIGDNINGPCVMKVPSWVKDPLGRYYLYFAHHSGEWIRLAVGDNPEGPFVITDMRILPIEGFGEGSFYEHIASPEVVVDEESQTIHLYFHAPHPWKDDFEGRLKTRFGQLSGAAISGNGLDFEFKAQSPLAVSYLRLFQWERSWYGLGVGGVLYRWDREGFPDGRAPMLERDEPLGNWRHVALHRDGDLLFLFYSRWGDAPERIVCSCIDLSVGWDRWKVDQAVTILIPEGDVEGANEPIQPSRLGAALRPLHELRDPFFYEEEGLAWLYYCFAGESGISVASLPQGWKEAVLEALRKGNLDLPDDSTVSLLKKG